MVKPEAIVRGSSSATSLTSSVSTGALAHSTSFPPFTADSERRSALSSAIEAPAAIVCLVAAIFSSSVTPSRGRATIAEPPPDTSARINAEPGAWATSSSSARAATTLEASGNGCAPPSAVTGPRFISPEGACGAWRCQGSTSCLGPTATARTQPPSAAPASIKLAALPTAIT